MHCETREINLVHQEILRKNLPGECDANSLFDLVEMTTSNGVDWFADIGRIPQHDGCGHGRNEEHADVQKTAW